MEGRENNVANSLRTGRHDGFRKMQVTTRGLNIGHGVAQSGHRESRRNLEGLYEHRVCLVTACVFPKSRGRNRTI